MTAHEPTRPPLFPEFAPLRRVAICRPEHYALREPINVIQAANVADDIAVSSVRALAEHAELVAALKVAGASVVEVPPHPRFPYQINTRDSGLGTPHGLIVGHFRLPVRQGEEARTRSAAAEAGVCILGEIGQAAFEGGDFVALDSRRAAVGLGARTEPAALPELSRLLSSEVELISVPFEERFLHLDMIFNVVAERLALAHLAGLPLDFVARLREGGFRLIEVSDDEVFRHGCNVLALGPGTILSHPANRRINPILRAEGFDVVEVDLTELARSGGGPRCLTLPLERG